MPGKGTSYIPGANKIKEQERGQDDRGARRDHSVPFSLPFSITSYQYDCYWQFITPPTSHIQTVLAYRHHEVSAHSPKV